jgi:hypothetical protein
MSQPTERGFVVKQQQDAAKQLVVDESERVDSHNRKMVVVCRYRGFISTAADWWSRMRRALAPEADMNSQQWGD